MKATLEELDTEEQAQTHQSRLKAQGFHPRLVHIWNFFKLHEHPAIKIKVPDKEFPEAKQYLRTSTTTPNAARTAVHCPECHSEDIQYPEYKTKFYTPTFVGFIATLFSRHKCYCRHCHHEWEP